MRSFAAAVLIVTACGQFESPTAPVASARPAAAAQAVAGLRCEPNVSEVSQNMYGTVNPNP